MSEGVETFWPRTAWRRRYLNERRLVFGSLYVGILIPVVLALAPGPVDQVWRYADTIVPVLAAGCAAAVGAAWLTARLLARRLDAEIAALPGRAAPHLEPEEVLRAVARSGRGLVALTDRRLFTVRAGTAETVTTLAELGKVVVENRAAERSNLVGAGLILTRDYMALDLCGLRGAPPPAVPPAGSLGEPAHDGISSAGSPDDPAIACPRPSGEEAEPEPESKHQSPGDQIGRGGPAKEPLQDGHPSERSELRGSLDGGPPSNHTEPEPEPFARLLVDRLVIDAFVRALHLAEVEVRDPWRMLPKKTFRVGERAEVEHFWPPPRREVARFLVSFGLLLLGVLSVPVAALLYALARARSPGVTDLGAHFVVMSGPVAAAVVILLVFVTILVIGQLFELRKRLREVPRRVELERDETLQAVCPARAARRGDADEGWAERVASLLRFDWHAFLVITDRRLLRYAGGRTAALADRADVVACARTPRGDDRAVLVAALLQAVGQTYELHVHLEEAEPLVVTAECLFFEPLVEWLGGHGFRLEGVGWVPDPPPPLEAQEPEAAAEDATP